MKDKKNETKCWQIVEAILKHCDRLLLYGPPGTGKTHAASRLGVNAKQRTYSVTLTEETPAAELRGHYILKDGKYVWQDGPAIAAWRNGSRLVVNEIQRGGPDVHALMLAITDDPKLAQLDLPSGEKMTPAAGFSCIATMNGNPKELLDPALADRFAISVLIDAVNPEAIAQLPQDLQTVAIKTALVEDEERRISIRSWYAFNHLMQRLSSEIGESEALKIASFAVFNERANEAMDALKLAKSGE